MTASKILTRNGRMIGHDEIVAVLGSEILSGARPAGSRMPTADELFERFGVSRVVMREVTKTLAAKGMIVAKSRVGTTVLPREYWNWFDHEVLAWRVRLGFDEDFLMHLVQMRQAVEPAAAALAAQTRTAADLSEIREALAAMTRAGDDRRGFVQADLDFHIAVAAASGNPLFRAFAAVVETALDAYFSLSTPMTGDAMVEVVAHHARIAAAIEQRDGDAAARAMVAVIDDGFGRIRV
jgi:DNA-binding FadR family transcriptional regulator